MAEHRVRSRRRLRRRVRGLSWASVGAALVAVAAIIVSGLGGDRQSREAGGFPFVRPVARAEAVVWAVGDGANGSPEAKAVAARIAKEGADRLLYLGDVYERGKARDFARNYQPTYGRLARITAPTPGNHDASSEASGYDPYWRKALGKGPADWYSFRAGGWQLISLDSEAPHHGGSAQVRWLRSQLRAAGTCRLVFWHRPRFSAGTHHGDQRDMAPVWAALRGHATIVLAGHEHDMQRFKPIDGITEFVSGAGGDELYALRRDPRLAFGNDRSYGALRLRLRSGRAAYAFVASDGRVLDRGTMRCRS